MVVRHSIAALSCEYGALIMVPRRDAQPRAWRCQLERFRRLAAFSTNPCCGEGFVVFALPIIAAACGRVTSCCLRIARRNKAIRRSDVTDVETSVTVSVNLSRAQTSTP